MKMKAAQKSKFESRKKQCNSRLTVKPKHFPVKATKRIERPPMFWKILQEVKQEYYRKHITGPRRERRIRMLDLARRTMRMIREESQNRRKA